MLIAPNFSIGAVLMMQFAAQAARFYESVEIIELHHPDKVDAPSGTARRTAELSRPHGARPGLDADTGRHHAGAGRARAARMSTGSGCTACGCADWSRTRRCCSATTGETLTIRHDSLDRESFMAGVLLGVRRIGATPGLTVGLEHFLDLD